MGSGDNMRRPRKIMVIGARGYKVRTSDHRVDSCAWDNLRNVPNLRDYDAVILNLLSSDAYSNAAWDLFQQKLDIDVAVSILRPDGRIVVLGDPRVAISSENTPFLC
jgi:hypothetical protein